MRTKNLMTIWFTGIDEEKKSEFEAAIRNSTIALGQLQKIVKQYLEQNDEGQIEEDHFRNPEWAIRQAFLLGRRKELKRIDQLLNGVLNSE